MLRFHLKSVFISRLNNIYLLFLNIRSPWHVWVLILFTCGADKTDKIMIYIVYFVGVFLEGSSRHICTK